MTDTLTTIREALAAFYAAARDDEAPTRHLRLAVDALAAFDQYIAEQKPVDASEIPDNATDGLSMSVAKQQKALALAKSKFEFVCLKDARLATPDYAKFGAAYTAFRIAEDALHLLKDYEAVLNDQRRLTRELDVALNGDGAAVQASLCDIVSQVKATKPVDAGVSVVDDEVVLLAIYKALINPNHVSRDMDVLEAIRPYLTQGPVSVSANQERREWVEKLREQHDKGTCGHSGYECLACWGINKAEIAVEERDAAAKAEQPDENTLFIKAKTAYWEYQKRYPMAGSDELLEAFFSPLRTYLKSPERESGSEPAFSFPPVKGAPWEVWGKYQAVPRYNMPARTLRISCHTTRASAQEFIRMSLDEAQELGIKPCGIELRNAITHIEDQS